MQRLFRHTWVAVVAGIVELMISVGATAMYLSSIEIDDGLEALMFFPILTAVNVPFALIAGWQSAKAYWPAVAAPATSAVPFVVVLIYGLGGPPARADAVFIALPFCLFAAAGGYVGYVVGRLARRSFRRYVATV